MTDPRYALAIGEQSGTYPLFAEYRLAVWEAIDLARSGETVTLLQVDGPSDDLRFTPLVTVSPPLVPTHSTSPEAPA